MHAAFSSPASPPSLVASSCSSSLNVRPITSSSIQPGTWQWPSPFYFCFQNLPMIPVRMKNTPFWIRDLRPQRICHLPRIRSLVSNIIQKVRNLKCVILEKCTTLIFHVIGMENGPEVINVTSNATTMLPGDTMTLRSASSLAALNNGGGGTLPRSSLVRNYAHGHGTLKKSADELRPLTADGHYHGHSHKPSMDTLRRVHFEKSSTPSSNGATPASPPKLKVF